MNGLKIEPKLSRQLLRRVDFISTDKANSEEILAPIRTLIKSSGIYALASVASPLVSLVLAPFLTHHLSISDYGILTILNSLVSLGTGITQLGLYSAFFRAYSYDYSLDSDKRAIVATTTLLLCLVSTIMVIVAVITSTFLAGILFGRPSASGLITLVAIVVLLQNLTIPAYAWLRATSRAFIFSLLAISSLVVTLIANIVLVGELHLGIIGSLLGTGCGYAAIVIFALPLVFIHAGLRMHIDIAKNLLLFGYPLVFNFVSYWILQLSDRYLLSLFSSLSQTATYAVAYNLGSALSIVIVTPFTMAWPTVMFTIAKREDAVSVFKLVFRWFGLLLLFAAFGLSLASKLLLDWFFPASYHSSAFVIPIIAESIVFFGIYYIFMIGANIRRKTWLAAIFTTIAALVNVVLNLFLIPHFGALGAAISTLLAFAVLVTVAFFVNQRIYPVQFEIGTFFIALVGGMLLYIGSGFLARTVNSYVGWGIYICAFALYGVYLIILGKGSSWIHGNT